MAASDTHLAIEAVFRIEWPRLIAGLARIVRDIGVADDLALEGARGPVRRAHPASRSRPRALGSTPDPSWAPSPRTGRGARRRPGPYALQAAVTDCHARPLTPEETDWARIAGLYEALAAVAPSPVVELNRAVAVGMASGPGAGLELVDALTSEPALQSYHLFPGVRGDLLFKLGRFDEVRAEFELAAVLTRNVRERNLLLERAEECDRGSAPPEPQ